MFQKCLWQSRKRNISSQKAAALFLFTIETVASLKIRKISYIKAGEGNKMKYEAIMKFVKAINQKNLPVIIEVMSECFCFIDTYGNKENKEQMKTGWQVFCDSKKQLDSMK